MLAGARIAQGRDPGAASDRARPVVLGLRIFALGEFRNDGDGAEGNSRYAFAPCATVDPPEFLTPDGTTVACHLHTESHPGGAALEGLTVSGLARPE